MDIKGKRLKILNVQHQYVLENNRFNKTFTLFSLILMLYLNKYILDVKNKKENLNNFYRPVKKLNMFLRPPPPPKKVYNMIATIFFVQSIPLPHLLLSAVLMRIRDRLDL